MGLKQITIIYGRCINLLTVRSYLFQLGLTSNHTYTCPCTVRHEIYFFLSILLIMALTSTGAEAAAALAFSSSSCCHTMTGWTPRLRF